MIYNGLQESTRARPRFKVYGQGQGSTRQLLDVHKTHATAKTGHEQTAVQRQTDATDRQIDHLVYELYGLTDDETAIMEI